ncbi:hypothetical protein OVA24_20430 [Luteolibacter sp. SL250]|uniref:hypothetical protein n=1 Tax=Luteolibacter sp. SL250 TaxID=2995170 RepID=UPI002271AD27|nr:hypothetical protein [Luteolibacter sp. SL250]WAC19594.1 hypothetical protein OVA24_20430 [Luteolibacter sp. SL250]
MKSTAEFEAIADRFSGTGAKLITFPPGDMMLDLVIDGVDYRAEFFPTDRIYGLSKTDGSSPLWEGAEESFDSADALVRRIDELLRGSK